MYGPGVQEYEIREAGETMTSQARISLVPQKDQSKAKRIFLAEIFNVPDSCL